MLKRSILFTITCLVMIPGVLTNKVFASDSFFLRLFKMSVDRPIYAYYDHSQQGDQGTGMAKLGFGFDSQTKDSVVYGIDYRHDKWSGRTQAFRLSGGYKYYANNTDKNYPFVDFKLFQTEELSQIFGNFCLGSKFSLFEKKTKLYAFNDIDWFRFGLTFGYDFSPRYTDALFAVVAYAELGLETIKLDTIISPNLLPEYKKTQYQVAKGGIMLANV